MGGKMSCLTNSSEPKSEEAVSNNGGPSSPNLVKSKSTKRTSVPDDHSCQARRYKKKQHHHKKNQKELTMSPRDDSLILEDSSAGFRTPRRKIHPSSSSSRQVPRSLIREAKDSMCLDRPMMISNNYWKQQQQEDDEEEEKGKSSEYLSVVSVKEKMKRVRFKLPHVVIMYSPEVVEEHLGYYCNTTREDSSSSSSSSSFYLTLEENFRRADGLDEFSFSLAVDTLPHASFSSGL